MGDHAALYYYLIIVATLALLPIVPAILTYKITPGQVLSLGGPFQGMTMNATGAFAAYLIVFFALLYNQWWVGRAIIEESFAETAWVIRGTPKFVGADGGAVPAPDLTHTEVRLSPPLRQRVDDTGVEITVPMKLSNKPLIYLHVPNWGGGRIILGKGAKEDALSRSIELTEAIEFRQQPAPGPLIGVQR
jgi:hypothetical protein